MLAIKEIKVTIPDNGVLHDYIHYRALAAFADCSFIVSEPAKSPNMKTPEV